MSLNRPWLRFPGRGRGKPLKLGTFTGNCLVRQHTGDGHYVGRCYHSTYDGVCHVHGNVSRWLPDDPIADEMTSREAGWPRDYEL